MQSPMTWVSRFFSFIFGEPDCKAPKSRENGRLAQRLLGMGMMSVISAASVALGATFATGCVVPPPLELGDPDAGANSPPIILSAGGAKYAFPGPFEVVRGEMETISVTLQDIDSEDTLFLELYVDYGINGTPTPSSSTCAVQRQETDPSVHIAACPTQSLCTQIDLTDDNEHFLEAMVSDEQVLNQGLPEFRALPEGTGYSFRAWQFTCRPELNPD